MATLKDTDYIYTVRRNQEDSPYFYDNKYEFNELKKFLSDGEDFDIGGAEFCTKEPDWDYSGGRTYFYITRLPKSAPDPEVWLPTFKKVIA